ncbi:MAG: sulfur carrier protein ThiS [Christensenellales bacterium]|nr:thiazole synthase [Clostridium sp. CAG:253]
MVHINGKDENAAGMTIQKYLDENDYIVTHIAVECNEKIVDKSDYSSYVLKDNDVVEIVSFVGGGSGMSKDTFTLGGKEFSSRFILGSGKYSMELIKAAVENAGAQIITLAVRRTNTKKSENILDYIPEGVTLLPNTSGARDAKEAVRIARMSRELGCGDFVKIEIMKDSKYLLPDNVETVKATEILAKEGFTVLPYMYPDLYTARDLANAGAAAIMPLASPIGSNKGLATKEFIQIIIDESDLPVIVDAGIGKPSQACEAMEMGAAAIMANTAIATAGDIPAMAGAFKSAIEAGRSAYLAGLGRVLERGAQASDPLTGFLRD